jgi:hypothetical protein
MVRYHGTCTRYQRVHVYVRTCVRTRTRVRTYVRTRVPWYVRTIMLGHNFLHTCALRTMCVLGGYTAARTGCAARGSTMAIPCTYTPLGTMVHVYHGRVRTRVQYTCTNITLSQKQLEIQALRCNGDASGRCQHRRHHGIHVYVPLYYPCAPYQMLPWDGTTGIVHKCEFKIGFEFYCLCTRPKPSNVVGIKITEVERGKTGPCEGASRRGSPCNSVSCLQWLRTLQIGFFLRLDEEVLVIVCHTANKCLSLCPPQRSASARKSLS